jgi:hypothetical protein
MALGLECLLFVSPPIWSAWFGKGGERTDLCIETFWELCRFDRKSFFVFESLDG